VLACTCCSTPHAQGVAVSYQEFNFGHLDFTFGVKEELRIYLTKLLRL
jgi:hypothetical protein